MDLDLDFNPMLGKIWVEIYCSENRIEDRLIVINSLYKYYVKCGTSVNVISEEETKGFLV